MKLILESEFDLGQVVYLKTDTEQKPAMIVAVTLCADGGHFFKVSRNGWECTAYACEISAEKDVSVIVTNSG